MAAIIKIVVESSGGLGPIKKEIDDTAKSAEKLGESAKSAGSGFSAMGEIATGAMRQVGAIITNIVASGLASLGGVLNDSIAAARDANQVAAQTTAVITSTGAAAGVSTQHVLDYAASLSAASGKSLFGDEQIAQSTNLLLTFTNIRGTVLDAATAISVDMAQAMGGAPKDAAIQLGKALNDPIKGVTALTKVGVTFSDEQKHLIETMVKTGDMAGAQQIILAELNKEFGGSAKAAAEADGGMAQLKDQFGELEETLGKAVLPVINQFVGFLISNVMPVLETFVNWFSANLPVAVAVVQEVFGGIGAIFTNIASQASGWGEGIINQLAGGMAAAAGEVIAVLQQLGAMIASWLQPHSPPRILPEIDKWGQQTAQMWVDGFGEADVKGITDLGSEVQTVLKNLTATGNFDQSGIIPAVLGTQSAMAAAIRSVDEFGNVSQDAIDKVVEAAGPAGSQVGDLVQNFFDLRRATEDVQRAQDELNQVTAEYAAKLTPLNAELKKIQDQKQAIEDQIRVKKLQDEIADGKTDDLTRQKDVLELQEISTRAQIAAVTDEKNVATDAAKQKLDAATATQKALQAQQKEQQATLQLYDHQNQLVGEQIALLDKLAKQADKKGGGGGAGISMPALPKPDMSAMTDAAKPIADIKAQIDSVKQSVTDTKDSIISAFQDMGAKIVEFMPTVRLLVGVFQAALPPIVAIVQTTFGIISGLIRDHGAQMQADVIGTWNLIQSTIDGLLPPIQITITTVFGVIQTFLHDHGADIQAFLAQTWDAIFQIINTALPLIQGIVTGVLAVITGFIRDHGAQIQQVFGDVWNVIKNVITGALAIIQGVLSAALAIFRGDWSGAWEAIKTMSVTVTLALGNIVKSFLDVIASYFGTSIDGIVKLWTTNWEMLKTIAGKVWEDVKTAVTTGWDEIKKLFGGFVSDMEKIGTDLVNGIKKGVSDQWGSFMNWIHDKVMEIPEPIRQALGIGSPSKVMADLVGVPIVTGIIQGIQNTIPALNNVIDQTGNAIVEANKNWSLDVRTSFQDAFHAIEQKLTDLANGMNDTIADAFTGAASLDRAKAKALAAIDDIAASQQQTVRDQLAVADRVASAMTDPKAAADFFKMRTDQILEIANLQGKVDADLTEQQRAQFDALLPDLQNKLKEAISPEDIAGINQSLKKAQEQYGEATDDTDKAVIAQKIAEYQEQLKHVMSDVERNALTSQISSIQNKLKGDLTDTVRQQLEDQITLITDAQALEREGTTYVTAAQTPIQAMLAQLADLKGEADSLFSGKNGPDLPADLDNPIMRAIMNLTNQLSNVTSSTSGNSTVNSGNSNVFTYAPNITTSAPVGATDIVHVRAMANV